MNRSSTLTRSLLGLALALPCAASATDVVGNINVDTRWTPAGSPYRLTGDVIVAPQATLIIEPGVEVIAAASDGLGAGSDTGKVELIVRGRVTAQGTLAQPIRVHGTGGASAWYGVVLEPMAGASTFAFVEISDAIIGLYGRSPALHTLSDLSLGNCVRGVRWQAAGRLVADRLRVNGPGAFGLELDDDGMAGLTVELRDAVVKRVSTGVALGARVGATIDRSHFVRNDTGISALSGSALTLTNSVVAANATVGLRLEQAGGQLFRIINDTFDHNSTSFDAAPTTGTGILVAAADSGANVVIRNNLVTSQGKGIEVASGIAQPALDHNDVWGNAANYTGAMAGAGSVSVNPLYVNAITWSFVSDPRSSGALGSGANIPWTFSSPGAAQMRLVISSLSTESCCDFLSLYDGAGNLVTRYSGTFSGPTAPVPGDTIRTVITTDGSVNSAGVTVSGYERIDPDTYSYRLQSSSPVIDVGNDIDAPDADADGTMRPYDGDVNGTPTVDLGAYEYHANVAPFAAAGPDVLEHPGTAIAFDGRASRDPDGSITSYAWDFGDGAMATDATASHAYASVGSYTVTLTVTDDEGVTATDSALVTIATNLPPTAAAGRDQSAMPGAVVTFDGSGSADSDGTIVSYAWDFGDGSPAGSGRVVTHSFANVGVYTVTLTVTDSGGATASDTASVVIGGGANQPPVAAVGGPYSGAPGQPVAFDGSRSRDPDGMIASYAWDFGDGAMGTGATPTHTYASGGSYLVRLTVTDNGGASDDDVAQVVITVPGNTAPTARAGGPYSGTIGAAVSFDGSRSSDPDGSIASYAWDFGDGSMGTGATPSHTYATAGGFLARLVVTDDRGSRSTEDVALVTIRGMDANEPPLGDAGGPYAVKVGVELELDGSGSRDTDGSVASYAWDFGDGSAMGSGARPRHTYAAAGNYTVRLTVTDDDGAVGQAQSVVVVTTDVIPPGNQPPVADAGGAQTVTVGATVLLNGADSRDPDGTIASYHWDLGDGSTADGAAVQHTYARAGSFLVKLTVTDDDGATDEDFAQITVNAAQPAPNDNDPILPRAESGGCTTSGRAGGSLWAVALAALAARRRRRA